MRRTEYRSQMRERMRNTEIHLFARDRESTRQEKRTSVQDKSQRKGGRKILA